MAMITPGEGRPQRDTADYQFPTGMYAVRLTSIDEAGPSQKFPNGNQRLVFEFTIWEGPYKGKKASLFVGKSLFKDPKTGKESNLIKLARSMGVVQPEKGFDPDTLKGSFFTAMCEKDESNPDGRTWVRTVIPAGAPGTAAPQQQPAPVNGATVQAVPSSGPPPRKPRGTSPPPPVATVPLFWAVGPTDADPKKLTEHEIRDMVRNGMSPHDLDVCPDGGQEYRPASEVFPGITATPTF